MIENDQITEVNKDNLKYTFKAKVEGEEKLSKQVFGKILT